MSKNNMLQKLALQIKNLIQIGLRATATQTTQKNVTHKKRSNFKHVFLRQGFKKTNKPTPRRIQWH